MFSVCCKQTGGRQTGAFAYSVVYDLYGMRSKSPCRLSAGLPEVCHNHAKLEFNQTQNYIYFLT